VLWTATISTGKHRTVVPAFNDRTNLLGRVEWEMARRPRLLRLLRVAFWPYGRAFDLRHGVATTKRVPGQPGSDRAGYEAVCGWHLAGVMAVESVDDTDVFVDIGSGKGRGVLLAASRYRFARVIGVERDEVQHEMARRNVASFRGTLRPIELVRADALDWKLPDDVTVMFLYNPFVGTPFLSFISGVRQALVEHPRPFRIVYANPRMHDAVSEAGFDLITRKGRVHLYRWPSGN
jgi:hypothetical protein